MLVPMRCVKLYPNFAISKRSRSKSSKNPSFYLRNELDLVDIWRIKNPERRSFTWSQQSPKVLRRLDYWLISNNVQDWVKSTEISYQNGSFSN